MFLLFPLLLLAELLPVDMVPADYNSSRFPKVKILDSKIVMFDTIGGEKFFGISALAYDPDTKNLFMLSDRSRLFVFALKLENDKIRSLKPLYAVRLHDKNGHQYFLKKSDSEGMVLVKEGGENSLLISFEQIPRVVAFDLKGYAKRRSDYTTLPKILQQKRNYRKRNNMLESITVTKKYGMVTTPEKPLRRRPGNLHGIYNTEGKICDIRMDGGYAITELETLPDGNLLALQRGIRFKPSLVISMKLSKIYLEQREKDVCRSETLFEATTEAGWVLDNFEGVTSVGKNRYLLVSDDNGNFFQKTLLVLVEIE